MFRKKPSFPKYICYLSSAKVDNLYSQITSMDINKVQIYNEAELSGQSEISTTIKQIVQAGLVFGARKRFYQNEEGQKNNIHKFREIIKYCNKHGLIAPLEECLSGKSYKNDPVLYTVTGKFTCDSYPTENPTFIKNEKKEADGNGSHGVFSKTVGRIAYLKTNVGDKELFLACSYKYFSDMGGSRICVGSDYSDKDYWEVNAHSGNHFFFEGAIDATFEAFFILNGQKENILFGSPLALINNFSSKLII